MQVGTITACQWLGLACAREKAMKPRRAEVSAAGVLQRGTDWAELVGAGHVRRTQAGNWPVWANRVGAS